MKNQKMIMVFALMVMTAFYTNAKNVAQLPEQVSENSDATSIVDAYLGIKNSLVGDDEKKAAAKKNAAKKAAAKIIEEVADETQDEE